MKYEKTFEVRWAEIDANWHMRNTAYAELGTTTRISFLTENGFPPDEFATQNFGPVILREETRYLREVRIGMNVRFDLRLSGISPDGSHFEFHHDVFLDDGAHAAALRVEGSWMDLQTRKLRVAPPALLDAMLALDRTEDFRELHTFVRKRS
jgi:acyl-CoA thioester hydrolase